MSVHSLSRSMTRAMTTAQQTAVDCNATLTARLPILFGVMTPHALLEWNRAITEKMEATLEGAYAAGVELQASLIRSAFRPPSPAAFADDMMRVIDMAGHPARLRVKANAKRLGRPGI